MQPLVLIDTSSWIEAFRVDGKPEVQEKVKDLLMEGKAAWCDMILLELWNGARGNSERKMLKDLSEEIPMLPITGSVWSLAKKLAQKCRKKGKTIPSTDILIAACGFEHEVEIEHQDRHFEIVLGII